MIPRAKEPTILVVDDEVDICTNLADIFEDVGFRVDTAHDGDAALDLIRSRSYDVVLLDLKMPGRDGLEVYRQIKRLQAGTIAIVISAHASTAKAAEALATGAWHVLAKPIEVPVLLRLVEQAVDCPLILVVDDDRELCANLWDLLRDHGCRVDLAHDVEEAARLLQATHFQTVLVDLKLPSGGGADLVRRVRSGSPDTRTILITAHRSETDPLITEVLREGAEAVCYKPFDIPRLLQILGVPDPLPAGPASGTWISLA